MSWKTAFAVQARSDLAVYELLRKESLPRCHQLFHLQMALEKTAKAYQSEPEKPSAPVHVVAHNFLKLCKANTTLKAKIANGDTVRYESILRGVLRIGSSLEDLNAAAANARAGVQGENVEYPFENANGEAVPPCQWAFTITPVDEQKLVRFLEIALEEVS